MHVKVTNFMKIVFISQRRYGDQHPTAKRSHRDGNLTARGNFPPKPSSRHTDLLLRSMLLLLFVCSLKKKYHRRALCIVNQCAYHCHRYQGVALQLVHFISWGHMFVVTSTGNIHPPATPTPPHPPPDAICPRALY